MALVVPGEPITSETGFLRGHGSYLLNNSDGSQHLISSVAGEIERVNKLISVRPFKSRYLGEIGDLIIGRITSLESKRWKVDINAFRDGNLQLSSVNLPGGAQRMRTFEDALQMRTLFTENDLISAEIQNISSDGVVSLHTRSFKFGKLENGVFLSVPSTLIRRLPQHSLSLPIAIDIILGKNGYIWITRSLPAEWKDLETDADEDVPIAETWQNLYQKHASTPLSLEERTKVSRVRNSIYSLSQRSLPISPENIMVCYQSSIDYKLEPKEMLIPENILKITQTI